jgi:flagellar protein FlaG
MQIELSVTPVSETPRIQALYSTDNSEKTKIQKDKALEKKPSSDQNLPPEAEVQKLQTALGAHDIALKFSRDSETKTLVVEMVDSKTGEAIRQIPNEVSLKLAAEFTKLQGYFVNKKA